jgi:hypothetical protein
MMYHINTEVRRPAIKHKSSVFLVQTFSFLFAGKQTVGAYMFTRSLLAASVAACSSFAVYAETVLPTTVVTASRTTHKLLMKPWLQYK